ncbi:MAG: MFS transporter [Myxococcales bacterium]|nr:MFS transporter [Myxococcales bacterium]MCB9580331.1 MFS transporter [Polyangiaceae bacterium]
MSERRDRNIAWGLTWLAYATYYTGRKGFSVAKKSIQEQLGVSTATLGAIDTAYLVAYSIGQFASGYLGDRIGARRLIGWGMLLSAACCAAFGASSTAAFFAILFCINGFAQSTGWPGTTRAMAEWTTPRNRGSVMAFWATCYQVGGIAATALAARLLGLYGWRWSFFGPAVWIVIVALAILWFLKAGPSHDGESTSDKPPDAPTLRERQAAQRAVLRNSVLWCYGTSYFAIKFIRYALLFWLPFFLAKARGFGEEDAGYVSTAFEVGGVVGVIVIGVASDRLRHFSRSLLASGSLVALAAAVLLYTRLDAHSTLSNVIGLALIGAALFGPDALISGAAAQDAGGPHAAAMATGFVNGMGSVGAVLQGLAVPWVSAHWGWQSLFWVFVALSVFAAVSLAPTFRRAPIPRAS